MSESTTRFQINRKDLLWSAKTFAASLLVALVFSMILYSFTMTLSEPAPVNDAITSTASAATAKVVVTAEYISPMWAIFIFNSLAVFSASVGAGLFLLIHPLLVRDIEMRKGSKVYTFISISFERLLMPLNRLLQKVVSSRDPDFASMHKTGQKEEGTIWQYCGYGKDDYRMLAYMLPYIVPVMILVVNGFLMGILLAFFVFNGALTGFQLFGEDGIIIGMLYNVAYFVISIVPHGIIEIPAILLAAAVGRRFAYIQSHEIMNKGLFLGDSIESLKKDVSRVIGTVREYLNSRYLWKMFGLMVVMLLIAAYIETYVTLEIIERVMSVLDDFVEKVFL
jgi:uncharacterized membrane protein SpoIIM required for sporulation